MENKNLGMIIREERKKKGLTQAQLGKLIGLKESRVSKIEHGAPITPEVASFILGKLGSALQIHVVDKVGFNQEESEFVVSVINNFADVNKNLSMDIGEGDRESKRLQAMNHHGLAGFSTYQYLCSTLYTSKR